MKRSLILSMLLLCAPALAGGKSNVFKTTPCSNVPPIALAEPDTVFVPVPFAVNVFKALKPREKPKCRMAGRVFYQGGCWLPERIKLMHGGE